MITNELSCCIGVSNLLAVVVGILLKAETVYMLGANLDNCGGGSSTNNGGSLKIFYVTLQGGSYTNTGRAYLKQLMLPEPGTVFEF